MCSHVAFHNMYWCKHPALISHNMLNVHNLKFIMTLSLKASNLTPMFEYCKRGNDLCFCDSDFSIIIML